MKRILYALNQPEFRSEPIKAFWRRLYWRLYHTLHRGRPLILRNWYHGMSIALPKSGSAAQVYYRKHSNVEIVRVMEKVLRSGDVVIDIGAHIGEYTLIAAALIGDEGKVYAIEPQPHAVDIIHLNAEINGLHNIRVHQIALGKESGIVQFRYDPKSWGGLIVLDNRNLSVLCLTLDEFVQKEGLQSVRLVKIDAAGNERDVLLGRKTLFLSRPFPFIICKFYHPSVVRERFGYDAREIVQILMIGDTV